MKKRWVLEQLTFVIDCLERWKAQEAERNQYIIDPQHLVSASDVLHVYDSCIKLIKVLKADVDRF